MAQQINSQLSTAITLLASLGVFDTLYLVNLHYTHGFCAGESQYIGNLLIDCGAIAASSYSVFMGVPIAFFGFVYYLLLLLLHSFGNIIDKRIYPKMSFYLATVLVSIGFVITLYLIYLQLFVLRLICSYCMASALITTILFAIHLMLWKRGI